MRRRATTRAVPAARVMAPATAANIAPDAPVCASFEEELPEVELEEPPAEEPPFERPSLEEPPLEPLIPAEPAPELPEVPEPASEPPFEPPLWPVAF